MDFTHAQTFVEYYPGQLKNWYREDNIFYFKTDNDVILAVHVLNDSILRFRYTTRGYFPKDFSYAIAQDGLNDSSFLRSREGNHRVTITTKNLVCKIDKDNLAVQVLDRSGHILTEDEKGFHWERDKFGGDIVQMSKKAPEEEYYFGLGDKTNYLNLKGFRFQNWCTDCFGYGEDTDPLYRSIPFYFGLRKGVAYGVFFDNSFRSYFDFGSERREVTSFWAQGGEMNYYVIYGPSLLGVSEKYTMLTGRHELPPMWALGYHQCRWSYFPEKRVQEIAQTFRDKQIPCDALYLDIDYMDGYRCFTWNNDHFPQPRRMVRELAKQGFKTVVIIDPGIKIDHDYPIFEEGLKNEYFCRRQDGPYVKGKVWPGECYFPDFTHPKVREWWAGLFRDLIRREGISGVWNDMNEPATFDIDGRTVYDDVRHDHDGNPCSHRKAHNIYGMQMSRATYEGVKRYAYPKRPFIITRASYSGGQRYASVWTGDNVSSWEHLRLANIQAQRMSISGFSFVGSDVGGFNDLCSGELLVRWLQLGIFHPLYRNHTMGNNIDGAAAIDVEAVAQKSRQFNTDQEPWAYGPEIEALAREAISMRYKLLPCLYTAFWQYITYGTPILRPLCFLDQDNLDTLFRMDEFAMGDHILVCPVQTPGTTSRTMYLPKGHWYNFYTDQIMEGRQEILVEAPLSRIPVHIRSGAIIPMYPVRQHVNERPVDQLTLHVYYPYGAEVISYLYEDEGDGYDYQHGEYLRRTFVVSNQPDHLIIRQTRYGDFQPAYMDAKIVLHGLPFVPGKILVDNQLREDLQVQWEGHIPYVILPPNFRQLAFKPKG